MKHWSEQEIFDALAGVDPASLVYTKEDRDRILGNPALSLRLEGTRKLGDSLRGEVLPVLLFSDFCRYEEDGDRTRFELGTYGYFSRRKKLLTFAILAWLYEKKEDIAALEDILWAILDEYTWTLPAHCAGTGLKSLQEDGYIIDLFAAETGFALTETVTLVGDLLHPIICKRVAREVEKRILSRADADFFWKRATHNWASVCGGNVGMTAMYTVTDNARLAHILSVSLSAMESYLSGIHDDGACLEGLAYWGYGFGYFVAFADMLRRRTAGKIDLFADEKVHQTALFYQKCFFPNKATVTFSDAAEGTSFSFGMTAFLHGIYPDCILPKPEYIRHTYQKSGCFRFAFGIRQMVWAKDNFDENTGEPAGTWLLPDAQWYLSTSENLVSIAAKAGNNGEPHNHNDIGNFEIYKNGATVIADIGGGEYTKEYFNNNFRYGIFCCGSQGHNVPIVEGHFQSAGGEFAAKDVRLTEGGITADIAGAYADENLRSLLRDIAFDHRTGRVTVSDRYTFEKTPTGVTERFLLTVAPVVGEDTVTIRSGGETMTLHYDGAALSVSLSTVTDKNHVVKDRTTYVLDFSVRAPQKEMTLTFVFD